MYNLLISFLLRNVPESPDSNNNDNDENNSSQQNGGIDYDDHQTFGTPG